jgi:broad specificity phosphatase PhoE|tara:strand:- start:23 stop:634 length:612 start_codon:yes stop_codon:yes gene_type:complete
MTRLILIRHGETNWNVERRKQGRNDQPLNAKGSIQAALAAKYVKSTYNVKKVWTSPLQRCANTAALFEMPVLTSDHLLEIDFGEWEGMLSSDIEKIYPGLINGHVDESDPPGGEKRNNLPVRARKWIDESNIANEDGDVVLVGHGGSMKGLLVALLNLPVEAMETLTIDNCSITVININPSPKIPNQLVTLNQTDHLTSANGS